MCTVHKCNYLVVTTMSTEPITSFAKSNNMLMETLKGVIKQVSQMSSWLSILTSHFFDEDDFTTGVNQRTVNSLVQSRWQLSQGNIVLFFNKMHSYQQLPNLRHITVWIYDNIILTKYGTLGRNTAKLFLRWKTTAAWNELLTKIFNSPYWNIIICQRSSFPVMIVGAVYYALLLYNCSFYSLKRVVL